MAYRRKARRGDHRMFMRTAGTTKKINITPKIMRGGIRL
uniref:50S ribosomal protein L34 n=1 Tax=Dulem virus 182 TaxID=3145659 RepID=A0AAU8ATY5_9VIRU